MIRQYVAVSNVGTQLMGCSGVTGFPTLSPNIKVYHYMEAVSCSLVFNGTSPLSQM